MSDSSICIWNVTQGLEPPRLRSSLRKTNYSVVSSVIGGCGSGSNSRAWNSSSAGGSGGGSGGGTPTNPTPPDSMHSEDSGMSAKETSSSQHSSVSAPRVRFSPVAASFSGDGRTLMDIPVQGQSQDYTIPLKVISALLLWKMKMLYNVMCWCRLLDQCVAIISLRDHPSQPWANWNASFCDGHTRASPTVVDNKIRSTIFFEMYSELRLLFIVDFECFFFFFFSF